MGTQSKKSDFIFIIITAALVSSFLLIKLFYNGGFIPDWDESGHITRTMIMAQRVKDSGLISLIHHFQFSESLYPPFYYYYLNILNLFLKSWTLSAVVGNSIFALMMMLSVYGIGSLAGNKKAGLLSALTLPFLPLYLTLQEKASIDYASGTFFMVSTYLLFKTDNFKNTKYSILYGISIAVNLITKWPFVIPAIPHILYALMALKNNKNDFFAILKNIKTAFLISLTGCIWYYFNYQSMIEILKFFWEPTGFAQQIWDFPTGLDPENLLFYSFNAPVGSAGMGLIALVIGYLALFRKNSYKVISYLKASVVITFLVLTYLNDKGAYYMVYIYPNLVLVITFFIFNLKNHRIKLLYFILYLTSVFVNFLLITLRFSSPLYFDINFPKYALPVFPNYNSKFYSQNWPTPDIARLIAKTEVCKSGIIVFPDAERINTPNIYYYLLNNGVNIQPEAAYFYYNPATDNDFDFNKLANFKCIVTKTGYPGIFSSEEVIKKVDTHLVENGNFDINTFNAPDESVIKLYIRK